MDAQIAANPRMTSRVYQFQHRRPGGGTFDYDPGHHTRLRFDADGEPADEDEEAVRPYTRTSLSGTG